MFYFDCIKFDTQNNLVYLAPDVLCANIDRMSCQIPSMGQAESKEAMDTQLANLVAYPASWFLFLDKTRRPFLPWENRRKSYFVYFSYEGFLANEQDLFQQWGLRQRNQDRTWEQATEAIRWFYAQVERKRQGLTWQDRLNPLKRR